MPSKAMAGAPRGPKQPPEPKTTGGKYDPHEKIPTVAGTITINRSHGDGPMPIRISIGDSVSGVEFVEVHMRLSDFAAALTGMGSIPVRLHLRGIERVGMKSEYKTEIVLVPKNLGNKDAVGIAKALKPHEIDGWVGRKQDATNHHNWSPDQATKTHDAYRVGFDRHVLAGPEDIAVADERFAHRVELGGDRPFAGDAK